MKTAFLFPGQGAQATGMGADLYNHSDIYRQTFDHCAAAAGLDLRSACFEGKGMDGSETIQPAIFAHTISLLRVVQEAGGTADVYAGLSLGEYSALCAAGVMEAAQVTALVHRRGAIMDGAFAPGKGGMLSVIGFTAEQLEPFIGVYPNVYLANHLSELQMVLAGRMEDLMALKATLEESGAKMVTLLDVKGPSHCPLLGDAAELFLDELEKTRLDPMNATVYANVLGAPYSQNADIRAVLCEQMRSRVRWHDCVEHMLASGVTRFVEIGPGNVLAKLLKRRAGKAASVKSVRDMGTLDAFLRECEGENK
jgi:[acyl-carrier-protein] S-malonyltransferase